MIAWDPRDWFDSWLRRHSGTYHRYPWVILVVLWWVLFTYLALTGRM